MSTASNGNDFDISGSVAALYPGDRAGLVLTITNEQPFAIAVTAITVAWRATSGACSASYLSVSSFSGRLVVPGRGRVQQTVIATMEHSAPDACQGALFALVYTGVGSKA